MKITHMKVTHMVGLRPAMFSILDVHCFEPCHIHIFCLNDLNKATHFIKLTAYISKLFSHYIF